MLRLEQQSIFNVSNLLPKAKVARELREAARREAVERAELSALQRYEREDRRRALKERPFAELSEAQREFLSREVQRDREARRECLCLWVLVLALVALEPTK